MSTCVYRRWSAHLSRAQRGGLAAVNEVDDLLSFSRGSSTGAVAESPSSHPSPIPREFDNDTGGAVCSIMRQQRKILRPRGRTNGPRDPARPGLQDCHRHPPFASRARRAWKELGVDHFRFRQPPCTSLTILLASAKKMTIWHWWAMRVEIISYSTSSPRTRYL